MQENHTKCQKTYEEIHALVAGKIPSSLNTPIQNARNLEDARNIFFQLSQEEIRSKKKQTAAKYMFPLSLICAAYLAYLYQDESPCRTDHMVRDFIFGLFVLLIAKKYQLTFGSVPLQSVGAHLFLSSEEAKQLDLEEKFDKTQLQVRSPFLLGRKFYGNINYLEQDAITRALLGVKNGVFDCVAISALVMLKLIEEGISCPIERVAKMGNDAQDPHSFVVVNRTEGTINNVHSWNLDAILIDPWYGVYKTAEEIQTDSNFFLTYPLLHPGDKRVMVCVAGNAPPAGYRYYLDKLNGLLDPDRSPNCIDKLWLGRLIPSLS
jgi:hypothetical protein